MIQPSGLNGLSSCNLSIFLLRMRVVKLMRNGDAEMVCRRIERRRVVSGRTAKGLVRACDDEGGGGREV